MPRLSGRTIIITGAAQGIGAVYAKSLAAEGARIAVCDLNAPDATVAAITEAGGEAFGTLCDISNGSSVAAFVSETVEKFGTIHGLVNNAAMFASLSPKPFEEISSEEFGRVLDINVRGTFEVVKAVTPTMRANGYGKIVNIGSGTTFKGTPMLLQYVSSKGAVLAMTRSLARELGEWGIRVNCVAPGLTLSEGVRDSEEHFPRDMIAMDASSRCIVREQVPDDLTGTVGFLLSAESDFISGQTVVVDGGSILH